MSSMSSWCPNIEQTQGSSIHVHLLYLITEWMAGCPLSAHSSSPRLISCNPLSSLYSLVLQSISLSLSTLKWWIIIISLLDHLLTLINWINKELDLGFNYPPRIIISIQSRRQTSNYGSPFFGGGHQWRQVSSIESRSIGFIIIILIHVFIY